MIPAINPETYRKRIQRGWCPTRAAQPVRRIRPESAYVAIPPPCPLNAAFRAWPLVPGWLEPGVRGNMRFGL